MSDCCSSGTGKSFGIGKNLGGGKYRCPISVTTNESAMIED